MKSIVLLFLCAAPLRAELIAHVVTTVGNIDVVLQYDKAPQAVANFITLANGTRAHINPATGALSYKPYYIGEKFFRIVNGPGFRIAQTGSGTGTNSGGPGYTYKDEFATLLRHVPYVLSNANSGPNTNGSQIFFTGNETINSLNDVHTIFGIVTDAASRATIDAVLAAGNDGSSITAITFERNDPEAVAFDEFAQNLPTITQPKGTLEVVRNVAAKWTFDEPLATGDIFRAFRSTTLTAGSWAELPDAKFQLGILPVGQNYTHLPRKLDNAAAEKEFFNLSYARHPGAVTPGSLHLRTVAIDIGIGVFEYHFNITGNGGTANYIPNDGEPFNFTFTENSFETNGAHSFYFLANQPTITPPQLLVKIGCDSATDTQIDGHHSTSRFNGVTWVPWAAGPAAISR